MLKTITLSLTLAMAAPIGLPLPGGQPTCSPDAGNAASGGSLCPHCGCRLVPVCHTYCATKKITEYKYGCVCEELCIPGITRLAPRCRSCEDSSRCAGACDTGNGSGQEGCEGRCLVREVPKLVKYPVTKEVPVRKCRVEWVCPKCGGGNCLEDRP
jgi:hypothetical protein